MTATRVVDAHNDLVLELHYRRRDPDPFGERWLAQLREGGVHVQVCPLYADPHLDADRAFRDVLGQLATVHRVAREHPDDVVLIRSRQDLRRLAGGDRIGLLLAIEGAGPLTEDLDLLDVFWSAGVRMVGPFWALANTFGSGNAAEDTGLTPAGRTLVERLAGHGFIIDLAHASPRAFDDMLAVSGEAPVVVTHAGCRALVDDPRNLSDEQLRALAARGGVLGVFAISLYIDPGGRSRDAVLDHVEHALAVAGDEQVGLGGDFIAQLAQSRIIDVPPGVLPAGTTLLDHAIDGLAGPADYPELLARLRGRGHAPAVVDSVAHGAFLRVFEAHLPA